MSEFSDTQASMFTGRISVSQYWLASSILIAAAAAAAAGALIFFSLPVPLGFIYFFAPLLVAGVPLWGLQVRRAHDVGFSGYQLAAIVLIALLVEHYFPISTTAFTTENMMFVSTKTLHPLGIAVQALTLVGFVILMSLPSSRKVGKYGAPTEYRSIWAAIRGVK